MIPPSGQVVLLVEDDRALQRIWAEALTEAGFSVLVEGDGDWALRSFATRPVDAMVLDLLLPGRSGHELAEEVRKSERGQKLPMVIVSGVFAAVKGKRELEERTGPLEWLDKPCPPARLVAAVQRALGIEEEQTDPETRRRRLSRARVEARRKEMQASVVDLAEADGVESESQVRFRGAALVRGNLRDTPFAEVLSQLHRWRATGALLLRNGQVKKIVYVREGAPQFVRSNLLSECLGQVLVRERMITEGECEESLRRMQTQKRQQGVILIEMGCISPANLAYALQLQQETKLYDVFPWREGDYRFNPREGPPPALVTLSTTPARILYDGIQRAYDGQRAAQALGDVDPCVVRLSDDPMERFQDMGLEAEQAQLFAQVDGQRTVAELLALAELDGLTQDDARRLLYALKCAGMIQLALPAPSRGGQAQRKAAPPPGEQKPLLPPVPSMPERALPEPELAAHQQMARLAARAQDIARGTLFEALRLPPTATEQEVHAAFAAVGKELHPDRLRHDAPPEARTLAEQIFQSVVQAHEVLGDPQRRAEYERRLLDGAVKSDHDDVTRILAAEERFRAGEQLLAQRLLEEARVAFADAVRLYPDEAEFHALLGWVTWLASPQTAGAAPEAEALLQHALSLNPRMDRAYVFRGHMQKQLGQVRDAEAEYEKALMCNPACAEALRELRLLEQLKAQRRAAPPGRRP